MGLLMIVWTLKYLEDAQIISCKPCFYCVSVIVLLFILLISSLFHSYKHRPKNIAKNIAWWSRKKNHQQKQQAEFFTSFLLLIFMLLLYHILVFKVLSCFCSTELFVGLNLSFKCMYATCQSKTCWLVLKIVSISIASILNIFKILIIYF